MQETTRVGIFGGTFDPVHNGHLRMAEEAREQLGLHRVLFVPNRVSPFKAGKAGQEGATDGWLRVALLQIAVADNPAFAVSPVELWRDGVSYTVDTLRTLHTRMPHTDLFFLTGLDAARELARWREPEEIVRLATVVTATRPGVTEADMRASLPSQLSERVVFIAMPALDISATDLRERARRGDSLRYLVPDGVAQAIAAMGLYAADNAAGAGA